MPASSCFSTRLINYLCAQSRGDYNNQSCLLVCLCVIGVCVCLCVCQRDYYITNQPISLKLDVVIGHANGKNRLTKVDRFFGDLVPDIDSGSLFQFSCRCRIIGYFRRFINIYQHAVTKLGKITHANKRMNPLHLAKYSLADIWILISPEI